MKVYSVSEFVQAVSSYLEVGLGSVAVQGEVTGFQLTHGKFVYFDLKDKDSRVKCFALRWEIGKELEDGMEIKVLGIPKLFQKSGQFHIRLQEVELVGAGALKQAYEKLKAKLEKEGIFDEKHKRPLPRFPQAIGLITSRDAAAYRDVLIRLKERWPYLQVKFIHTSVQGLGAAGQIIKAIRYFNENQIADVLILTRGGGSAEELQVFNDEEVVRAVFSSRLPIIVGVGHERDVSLAELAADKRASTPTNAAEIVVPHRRDVYIQINKMIETISHRTHLRVRENMHQISRVIQSIESWFKRIDEKVDYKIKLLQSVNPMNVLKRGYSISIKDGRAITDAAKLKKGDKMTTKFYKGEVESIVD